MWAQVNRWREQGEGGFGRILPWLLLFVMLVLAIWLPAQGLVNPLLILTLLLFILTYNFSAPLSLGGAGLAPVVAITSLLVNSLPGTLLAVVLAIPLAELWRPFWRPLWRATPAPAQPVWQRSADGLLLGLATGLAGLLYAPPGGQPGLIQLLLSRVPTAVQSLFVPAALALVFMGLHALLTALYWRLAGRSWLAYLSENAPFTLGHTALAVPFIVFVASLRMTVPAFVLLTIGLAALSVVVWTAWQRRFVLAHRLSQLAALNQAAARLRETLDLPTVLAQAARLVAGLVPSDGFTLALRLPGGGWQRAEAGGGLAPWTPDDLSAWVGERGALLELDRGNIHYAARHQLRLPLPPPDAWIGLPLTTGDGVIGVMVLHKTAQDTPFSRWEREVLVAVASQISAAIHNARRYSESVRLYTLADEALARRAEQLQALLFSIDEGVLMLDSAGRVVLLNPKAAALLGDGDDIWLKQFLSAEAAAALGYAAGEWTALLDTLRSGSAPAARAAIYPLARPEGRRYFQRAETAVRAVDAQLMGWLLVLRDVTEERERSEWRADLTRMIVHDLRNPITTLSSALDLLERADGGWSGFGTDESETRPYAVDLFATARRSCDNLLEMVDSLMDINRAEAGRFVIDAEAMRLTTLSAEVLDYLRPLAVQRSIHLTYGAPPDLPPVWGDRDILRRVLINLLDNALKFTPAGGQVTLSLTPEPTAPPHAPGVRLSLHDDGPGIAPDQRARIFDRFVTFNRGGGQVRGAGLGLTFCKLAVEAHGGRIWVEDAPGRGSVFLVTLPGVPSF